MTRRLWTVRHGCTSSRASTRRWAAPCWRAVSRAAWAALSADGALSSTEMAHTPLASIACSTNQRWVALPAQQRAEQGCSVSGAGASNTATLLHAHQDECGGGSAWTAGVIHALTQPDVTIDHVHAPGPSSRGRGFVVGETGAPPFACLRSPNNLVLCATTLRCSQ